MWYQKRFLKEGKTQLYYLDLAPPSIAPPSGKGVGATKAKRQAPKSCFWAQDLYTTLFFGKPNDEIEHFLFGSIDDAVRRSSLSAGMQRRYASRASTNEASASGNGFRVTERDRPDIKLLRDRTVALIKCTECGKEISSNAMSCPNCGNNVLTKSSQSTLTTWNKVGISIVVLIAGVVILGKYGEHEEAARLAALPPEQRIAEEKRKQEQDDILYGKAICENQIKETLDDPGSAQFDDSYKYLIIANEPPDHYRIMVTLRAKNAFNALRHIAISCDLTRASASSWHTSLKEVTSLKDIN